MVIARGDVWWVDLGTPVGAAPGFRRPVVIVSSDFFNDSAIGTVIVATITTNQELARSPGNVPVTADQSGLPSDSVVNVTQLASIDKRELDGYVGRLDFATLERLEAGLRLALDLDAA